MSMLTAKFGVLLPVVLAAGCGSSGPVRLLAPAAGNPAVVERGGDGMVTLRSQGTHVVSVLPLGERFSSDVWGLPAFYVIVTNGGQKEIRLKPEDISAWAGDQRVMLLTPAALQDRLDRAQAAAGSTSNFPLGMRDASQPGEVRHNHPSPLVPAVEPYHAPEFKVPTRLANESLQAQVIRPGDVGGGRIVLEGQDILSGLPLKIAVSVAGEQHAFLFDVRY